MIRTVKIEEITNNVKEMCIEANHVLSSDMEKVFLKACLLYTSPSPRD